MMSREQFIKLAKSFIPKSELERFASNVFKLFDEDKNGFLDFGEFSLAISAQVTIYIISFIIVMHTW